MRKIKLLLAVVVAVSLLTPLVAAGQQRARPEFGRDTLRGAIAVQERYTRRLVETPLVVGTGVSVDASGRGVVKVYAESAAVRGVPPRLDGVPVVVEVTGPFVALGYAETEAESAATSSAAFDTTARLRPAYLGMSTGHPDITAGTIGARVRDRSGNTYALSNNHVYANINQASIGDNVLQPGSFDGGLDPQDAIGTLWDYVPFRPSVFQVNYVDAAIALVSENDLLNSTPPDGYGVPSRRTVRPRINMQVMKYGRTTNLTTGVITDVNVFTLVGYGPNYYLWYDGQIMIGGADFSAGGDSGSLVVVNGGRDDRKAVGLLFAGSNVSTLANPIRWVLSDLGVRIDGQ